MSESPALAVRVFETPLGRVGVAATARGVVRVMLPNEVARHAAPGGMATPAAWPGSCAGAKRGSGRGSPSVPPAQARAHVAAAECQIRAYCAGRRRRFTVPIGLSGTPPFHRKVLAAARRIPYGRTVTYGELARLAGNPRAARAVGQAMAHNPVALIVPCHRVVAAGGGLGGFGGGLALKRRLLALEGAGHV